MTPTVTPSAAFARVTATGPFVQDGFIYEPGPSEPYGPEDTVHATHDATGAQFCVAGEPGTPISAADGWVLV
jgi:hypothetical protein